MILVFQFFSTFPKSSVLHFPRFVLFWRFKKTRHGKMHEVRYRKICLFNSVEDCFLYNCGYSSSFPLSRSVMLHFPTRFHQNQKRMLSFEDHFSFPPQTAPTTFKHLKSESSHHRLCTTTKSTFRKSSKLIFDISSFSIFHEHWKLKCSKKHRITGLHGFTVCVFQQWSQKHDFSETWFYRNSFLVLSGTKRWF